MKTQSIYCTFSFEFKRSGINNISEYGVYSSQERKNFFTLINPFELVYINLLAYSVFPESLSCFSTSFQICDKRYSNICLDSPPKKLADQKYVASTTKIIGSKLEENEIFTFNYLSKNLKDMRVFAYLYGKITRPVN